MKEFSYFMLLVTGCLGQMPLGVPNMSPAGMPMSPAGMTNPPVGMTNQPAGMTNQPAGMTNQPAGMRNQPVGMTNQPAGMTNQPAGMTNQPAGMTNQPAGMTNQPAGMTNQPAGMTNIPAGMTNQPAGMTNQPTGMPNMPSGGGTNTQSPAGVLNMPTNMPVNALNMQQGGQSGQDGNGGMGGTPSPIGGPANVNRPCRRYDIQCVRYFFKDHSQCKQPYGKIPEPLYRAISNQFYPAFNLTVTNTNSYYTGFNRGRVEDLYVNRDTDKVVLTIDFRDLKKSSRDVFIRYHRRAREPIITYGYGSLEYKSLIVTVTIPQIDNLRLDKADIFGYSNTLPVIEVDPRLGESSDPSVARSFNLLRTELQTTAKENLLTEAAFFAAVYIQNVICDFGLKLI